MMSTWSYSHKPMPSTLSVVCFSYTSRLKWCLQEPKKQCPAVCYIQDVSLTHPGWNGAYRNSFQKTVPGMLYTRCFSYTSRLKWCLRQTSPTKPCPELSLCFSYTSRLKWCLRRTFTNPCPLQYLLDVSLTHPGRNCVYTELLPQTHAQHALWQHVSLTFACINGAYRNSSHEPIPRMLSLRDLSLKNPGWNGAYWELSQTNNRYAPYRMFLIHIQS